MMSMPFEFISNLKVGTWTRLDPSWLRRLQKFLTNADNHVIKQIRFVRTINRTMMYAESQEYEDENDQIHMKYFQKRVTNIM